MAEIPSAENVEFGRTGSDRLHSVESELALVGAALYAPEFCEDILDRLPASQFGDPLFGRIWKATAHLKRSGRAVAPAFVRDALGVDPAFEEWGGALQLARVADQASLTGLEQHAAAIVDRFVRRGVQRVIDRTQADLPKTDGDALELLADLERGAAEVAQSGATGDHWLAPAEMILAAAANARKRRGVLEYPSGLGELDRLLGGLHRGEMTLFAARSGMGKSTAAQRYANATASGGKGVLYISLEMDADPMALRLACDVLFDRQAVSYGGVTSNITVERAMKGDLDAREWDAIDGAAEHVRSWPFLYEVRPGLTMAQIEAMVRRKFRTWERAGIEPGLVVIDHLGKVKPSKDRKGSRHNEVADVSSDTAELAKRLNVPVLGLVQLNRQVEGRDDKRPQLNDLRQAGELEEDARQVVFVYRPEYYLREGKDGETVEQKIEREAKLASVQGKFWWIVEKNSHGARGQALTYCDMACSAIRDWNP